MRDMFSFCRLDFGMYGAQDDRMLPKKIQQEKAEEDVP